MNTTLEWRCQLRTKLIFAISALAASSLVGFLSAEVAEARGFGDWMNPSEWFGGNRDRDYYGPDYRGGPGYGYGAPGYGWGGPGYGYGAPGYGWGGPGYGYGAPGYGYGGPGYGYGAPGYGYGAPGYGTGAPAYGAPAPRYEMSGQP